MNFEYMYGTQADQYSFIHIPKLLVTEKVFTGITLYAKVLYGLLLDRIGMAVKNKWIDEENRMYVVYPIQEIQKDMGVTRKKAKDCLTELEQAGLIEKHFRGMGLPSIYYVKNFYGNLLEKGSDMPNIFYKNQYLTEAQLLQALFRKAQYWFRESMAFRQYPLYC